MLPVLHLSCRHVGVEQAAMQPAEFLMQVDHLMLVAFVLPASISPGSAYARDAAWSRCARASASLAESAGLTTSNQAGNGPESTCNNIRASTADRATLMRARRCQARISLCGTGSPAHPTFRIRRETLLVLRNTRFDRITICTAKTSPDQFDVVPAIISDSIHPGIRRPLQTMNGEYGSAPNGKRCM